MCEGALAIFAFGLGVKSVSDLGPRKSTCFAISGARFCKTFRLGFISQANRGFGCGRHVAIRIRERSVYMASGTVKWFNDSKGFGFITQDDGGEDVFCHHTAIHSEGFRTLQEGQKVEFEVTRGAKGLQAANVKPV